MCRYMLLLPPSARPKAVRAGERSPIETGAALSRTLAVILETSCGFRLRFTGEDRCTLKAADVR